MATTQSSGHASGKKIAPGHSTVIHAAAPIVDAAIKSPLIKKIGLGLIKTLKSGEPLVKILEENPTCLLVKVRGRNSLQEIRLYFFESNQKELVEKLVKDNFK